MSDIAYSKGREEKRKKEAKLRRMSEGPKIKDDPNNMNLTDSLVKHAVDNDFPKERIQKIARGE